MGRRSLISAPQSFSRMESPGRLSRGNLRRLKDCGAEIRDRRPMKNPTERDIVINYHVSQLLNLRQELLEALVR